MKQSSIPAEKNYESLFKYASVVDWSKRFSTEAARRGYLPQLLWFTRDTGLTPDEFLALQPKAARDKVWEYIKQFRDSPRKAGNLKVALSSFYRHHNEVKLEFDARKGGKHYIKYVKKHSEIEIIPNKGQVYSLADAAVSLRDRAIILVLWQSGIRNNALCNLRYGHVQPQLEKGEIPLRLKITPSIDNKLGGSGIDYYYTFLGGEAVEPLKAYIGHMAKRGYKWTDDSPLFLSKSKRRMVESAVQYAVKKAAARAPKELGLKPEGLWPHCLRKAFRKVLNAADFDEDTKEALMGHTLPGSRQNYFDVHDVDEIAQKYMKADWSRGRVVEVMDPKRLDEIKKEIAQGYQAEVESLKKIVGVLLEKVTAGQVTTEEAKTILGGLKPSEGNGEEKPTKKRGPRQKVIDASEVESALASGEWRFVSPLNNDKAIIEKL